MDKSGLKTKLIDASICGADQNNAPIAQQDTILFRVDEFPTTIKFFLKIVLTTEVNGKNSTIRTSIHHLDSNPKEEDYEALGSGSMLLMFNELITTNDILIGMISDKPIEYKAKKQGFYKIKVELLQYNDSNELITIDTKEFCIIIVENIVKMG